MPKSPSPSATATSRHSPNNNLKSTTAIDLEQFATERNTDTETLAKLLNLPSLRATATNSPDPMQHKTGAGGFDVDALSEKDSDAAQQFYLRWNNYQRNLTNVFDQLLHNESFVDVTLACDGKSIKAHKMVLSACSPYFQSLFIDNPCQHPIVIMRDVKWLELKAIVEFMYKGEIKICQTQIEPLLRVAELLQIRGLADVNGDHSDMTAAAAATPPTSNTPPSPCDTNAPPPMKKSRPIGRGDTNEWNAKSMDLTVGGTVHVEKMRRHKRNSLSTDSRSPKQSAHTPDTHFPTSNSNATVTSTSIRQNSSPSSSTSSTIAPTNTSKVAPTPPPSSQPAMSLFPSLTAQQAAIDAMAMSSMNIPNADDMEIKPGIAEMIREEERAKLMENTHAWPVIPPPTNNAMADSYQYQLQSMWQKCWSTNQNLIHHLRFRERGPLKSWRPETMAEAIFSVLKEGLSLSQAARKYDIPYPTFVLYANRVHNMLGPSLDGGPDLRPKGRGRPQRILLGLWPDDHIKAVIKAVVFRDAKEFKEDPSIHLAAASAAIASYGRQSPMYPFGDAALGFPPTNGIGSSNANDALTSEAAAAVAAVVGLRQQQMRNHSEELANFALPTQLHSSKGGLADVIPLPKLGSPATANQLNNNADLGFSMPRLASPAMPGMHGIGGLSGLHLMQNFGGGNNEMLVNNSNNGGRRRSSTHTDAKSHSDARKSSAHSSRNSISNGSGGSDHSKKCEKNNNNNCPSNGERNELSQELRESSRYIGDDLGLADMTLPFKPMLRDFLSIGDVSQLKYADDLSEFERASNESPSGRSIDLHGDSRDKIKVEPGSDNSTK